MSDPVIDALNAAAQRGGAAPAPGQPMSAPAGVASQPTDPVLAALQQRAAQPDVAPAPQQQPRSVLQQTGDFIAAGAHHAANLPWSAGQLLTHVIATPMNWLPDNPVSRGATWLANDFDKTVAQREATYQASTPNSPGAYMGATVGSIAPFLTGGIGGGLQAAGDATAARVAPMLPSVAQKLGARIVSGATQGAIAGAAQPVTQGAQGQLTLADLVAPEPPQQGSFWDQKANQVGLGAAFGAAVPVVTAPISAAWNAGKTAVANSPILNPSGYAARQIGIQLGVDAPTVAGDLAAAPTYVPGSVPTSAQAGADPRLVMMEKALANSSPDFKAALAARENANNAARLQAVGQVAQTPTALQAAIDQRAAVTGPMRDFAVTNGNPVPVGGVQGALSSLSNGSLGVRPTIGGAASGMRSAVDDMTTVTPPNTLTNTPGSATAQPAMLDALRQNANDYLSKFAPQGFVGTQEQAAMAPVKSAIIDAIDAANPGHKLNSVVGPLPQEMSSVIEQPVPVVKKWGSRMANESATRQNLPAVPDGHIRLYRADSPSQRFGDVFDASGLTSERAAQIDGQRYTPNFRMADYYRDAYNSNGDASIHYIDLPNEVATPLKVAEDEYKVAPNSLRFPTPVQRGAPMPDGGIAGPEAPSYRDYLTEFAKRSVPVNTMQVGQQLQDTLNSKALNSGGDPMATLTNYQSALAKALRGSDYGIDPAAQAQLEGVGSDLQRATISNSIRAPGGSDTAYNAGAGSTFLRAMGADSGNDFGKMATAGGATLAATGSPQAAAAAAFGAKKAGGFVTNRVAGALGDLMLDPQKLAQALMGGSPQLAAASPSAFGQLTGRAAPAINAALAAELLKAQAPQVIDSNRQKAQAYQP